MRPFRPNSFRLAAFILTLVVLFGHSYLPQRMLQIHPNTNNIIETYTDSPAGGKSVIEWLDKSNFRWKCTITQSDTYPVCGLSIIFSQKPYKSVDFSRYSSVFYRIEYEGSASKLRFFLRNYNAAYATRMELEPAKFQSVAVRTTDFDSSLKLDIAEFSVADWWKDEFDIPRELSRPESNAIVAFGIDQASPIAYGEHTYQLKSVELIGEWISRETLYLAIIVSWTILLGWETKTRLVYWYQYVKRSSINLDEARAESEKYKELMNTDSLTGVLNRNGLIQMLSQLNNSPKNLSDYSVLVADIDFFKQVNDLHGHVIGDAVLTQFTTLLSDNIRADDVVVRWGGEEFVLLLQTSVVEEAKSAAEVIRRKIAQHEFMGNGPLHITVSIGVSFPAPHEDFEAAFIRADKALYTAKIKGRNQVILHQ